MMGGLAYMTGLPGRPLRAGSSVNDIMGGIFGAHRRSLAALRERETTGRGQLVHERAVREHRLPGRAAHGAVRAHRRSAAADVGEAAGLGRLRHFRDRRHGPEDARLFVGVVTDTQWEIFCREFGLADLAADPRLRTQRGTG